MPVRVTGHPVGISTREQVAWVPVPVRCQASKLTLCREVALFGPDLAVYAGTVAGYRLPVEPAGVHMGWTVAEGGTPPGVVVGPGLALVEKAVEQLAQVRSGSRGVGLTVEHYMATVLERSLVVGLPENSLVHPVHAAVHRY